MPRKKRKNNNTNKDKIKEVSQSLEECHISENPPRPNIMFSNDITPEILAKWPKPKPNVPAIFLHKPCHDSSQLQNLKRILGIGKCFLICKPNYLKFSTKHFDNHKFIARYFESKNLPYHTFGHPDTRMMKVVVRNLPVDTNIDLVKEHLQKASIPVVRLHKMHTPEFRPHTTMLVLVIVPNNSEGQKMLRVTHILGHEVKLEPAHTKTRQCYRCQKWGHSQRYCKGEVKCVKCAGDHFTLSCTKDPGTPATCANCGGDHTANYKKCSYCPESKEYKKMEREKLKKKKCKLRSR